MEVYDIKINIFQEVARLPSFVERFIEWYGGEELFYYEMAFYYRAERDRRAKRGEDRERAVKMAEEMVNDLVVLLAKEYFIWDNSIQVIERYPDASVISPEFVEFYGGLNKLREDMMPFFKLECERRMDSFKEKSSVAKFMAGTVVNWMVIRLARENGFLEIKKIELPHFKFPSLKRDEEYESDHCIKLDKRKVVSHRWSGDFGTDHCGHGTPCSITDVLSFVGCSYTDVDIKGILLKEGIRAALLTLCRYDIKAALCVRPSAVTSDFKPWRHDTANTMNRHFSTLKGIVDRSTRSQTLAFTQPLPLWKSAGQPPQLPVLYADQLLAGNYTDSVRQNQTGQIIQNITSLDIRCVAKVLMEMRRFQMLRQTARALVPYVTMTARVGRLMSLTEVFFQTPGMNATQLHVADGRSLVYRQTAITDTIPKAPYISQMLEGDQSRTAIAKPETTVLRNDDLGAFEKAVNAQEAPKAKKKSSKLGRLRRIIRRLCCCARHDNDDD